MTLEALTAWGEDFLKRLDDSAVPERAITDDGMGTVLECAARLTDAARGINEGSAAAEGRLSVRIETMNASLAAKLSAIGATARTDAIEQGVGRVELDLGAFRKHADGRIDVVASGLSVANSRLYETKEQLRKLKFGWYAFLSPWVIFVFFCRHVAREPNPPGVQLATGGRLSPRRLLPAPPVAAG